MTELARSCNQRVGAAYTARRMPRPLTMLLATSLATAGCVDADDRSASWPAVHATIIAPSCATSSCHSNVGAAGGIDLRHPELAYAFLTGRVCGAPELPGEPPGNYVWPGDPGRSRLLSMLRADQAPLMPPDRPLATPEIELVEAWILAGAACQ